MSAPILLLDIDDTLLDFHKAEALALGKTLRAFGMEPEEAILQRYSAINKSQWELLEEGLLTREQVLLRRFELLFGELGLDCDPAAVRDSYEHNLSIGHYFMPGAEELLAALRGKYRLFIASNGSKAVQEGRLRSAGIGPCFEGIFISEEIGHEKPTAAFFEGCFAQIPDFDRARTLMVGDSLTSDIRGGRNAGIKTCWYNPQARPGRADIPADHEIRDLGELPGLLKKIM